MRRRSAGECRGEPVGGDAAVGIEKGSRPDGLLAPVSTSARALPPSMPAYHIITIAGTSWRQASMSTAPAATTQTTVLGLARVTARMISSSTGRSVSRARYRASR